MPQCTLLFVTLTTDNTISGRGCVVVTPREFKEARRTEFTGFEATCQCRKRVVVCRSSAGHYCTRHGAVHTCQDLIGKGFDAVCRVNHVATPECGRCYKVGKLKPVISVVWQNVPSGHRIVVYRVDGMISCTSRSACVIPNRKYIQDFFLHWTIPGLVKLDNGAYVGAIKKDTVLCRKCRSMPECVDYALPQFVCKSCNRLYGSGPLKLGTYGELCITTTAPPWMVGDEAASVCGCGRVRFKKPPAVAVPSSKVDTSARHCILSAGYDTEIVPEIEEAVANGSITMLWIERGHRQVIEGLLKTLPPMSVPLPDSADCAVELVWIDTASRVVGGCGMCGPLQSNPAKAWPCKTCLANMAEAAHSDAESDPEDEMYLDIVAEDVVTCYTCQRVISASKADLISIPPLRVFPRAAWDTLAYACADCSNQCVKCGEPHFERDGSRLCHLCSAD